MPPTRSGLAALALVLLAGCAGAPATGLRGDGRFCARVARVPARVQACTSEAVPTAEVETEAKRFEPSPDRGTLYLLRSRWADARHVLRVVVDGQLLFETLPQSLVRLRLPPGEHRLQLLWGDDGAALALPVAAGELRFLAIEGQTTAWGSRFGWAELDAGRARAAARTLRLVADARL